MSLSSLLDAQMVRKMNRGVGPSSQRRFQYGVASSTWLGGDLFRMGKAAIQPGDYKENIQRIEQERLSKLRERFPDIREEDLTSKATMWGQMAGMVFDPAMFGTMYLAAPVKGAQLTKLGLRAKAAGVWGAEGAVRSTAYQSSRGHDVDPTYVALGALLGTTLGGAFPYASPRKALFGRGAARETAEEAAEQVPRVPTGISSKPVDEVSPSKALRLYQGEMRPTRGPNSGRIKDPVLSPSQEKDIQESLLRALENPDMPESILKNLIDVPNIAALYTRRDLLKLELSQEIKRRSSKEVGAISDGALSRLQNEFDRVNKAVKKLGDNPIGLAINDVATGVETGIKQLGNDGLLTAASIRKAMIRPIIGAVGGYGTGVAANIFSEEDDFSPLMFAMAGMVAGAASIKINKSTFAPIIKTSGNEAAQDIIKISNWAHANVMLSATSATRLNSFGGLTELFSKTLFNQAGADLRGAAITSVEARQALVMQEINHVRRILLENQKLGGVNFSMLGSHKDVIRLREASGKYLRGLYGRTDEEARAGLGAVGFNAEEISLIFNSSGGMRTQMSNLWKVFTDVLPDLKKLDDYGLPQFHNHAKIFKNETGAKEAYGKAFYQQALSNIETAGKKSIDDLSESALKRIRSSAQRRADKYVDDIITKGSPNPSKPRGWMVSGDKDYRSPELKMAPLIDHLEFDRKLTNIKAIREIEEFMIWDVEEVMSKYVQSTIPTLEFARTFGAKGELIRDLKTSIQSQFTRSTKGASASDKRALHNLQSKQMKSIHDAVDMYFGRLHATSRVSGSPLANHVYAVSTTLANLTYLPKVTISSLGDLVQPFQNSGVMSGMRGMSRALSKKTGFHNHGFGDVDVMSHELQAYTMRNTPGSTLQAVAYGTNQKWFQLIGLAKLTSFARKFAYNTGIEDGFDVAQRLARGKTNALTLKANTLGISDDVVKHLKKFKTVDDAWADDLGQTYLNRIGKKAADRDALLPQIGNRRGFSQSKNPAIRATGQFLSWAQAKSAQTNSLIARMESGDAALAVRMLGTLVIYDGILTFRDFLNDPTGKRLDKEGVQSYKDNYLRLQTMARSSQFSGNVTPWYIDKVAGLMSTNTARNPLSNVAPSLGWLWDMATGFSPIPIAGNYGSVATNIARDDPEGALVQALKRLPLGQEYMDLRAALGDELVDKPSPKSTRYTRKAKGGIVENVAQVPKEPDERIDKMTGLPYNVQAGTAFIDEEDPEKRTRFIFGGLATALRPLFSKAASFPLQHLVKETAGIRDRWASAKLLSTLKPSSSKAVTTKVDEVFESPAIVTSEAAEEATKTAASAAGRDLERLKVAEDLPSDSLKWYDALLPEKARSLWTPPKQELTSEATSINLKRLPQAFTQLMKEDIFKSIRTGLDIGGGRANNVIKKLKKDLGFNLRIYDPFNRSPKHNAEVISQIIEEGGVDAVFNNNTLNVIREKENQLRIVQQARDVLRDNKTAYFSVYEGNKTGVGKTTTKGWQEHKPLEMYKELIEEVFGADNVTMKNGVIRAVKKTESPAMAVQPTTKLPLATGTGRIINGRELFKNLKGTSFARGNKTYPVGKVMGNQVYFHKNYIGDMPKNVQDLYKKALDDIPEGFEFNTLMYESAKKGKPARIRFDEAPDFNTAREPTPGKLWSYWSDGNTRASESKNVWHHKWQWVGEDYKGFNIDTSYDWSRQWTQTLNKSPKSTPEQWRLELIEHKLPLDVASPKKTGFIPIWKNNILQRKIPLEFGQDNAGPLKTTTIFESGKPKRKPLGSIRKTSGGGRKPTYLVTIKGAKWPSTGIVKGVPINTRGGFKTLKEAKNFTEEYFNSAGKDWMKG